MSASVVVLVDAPTRDPRRRTAYRFGRLVVVGKRHVQVIGMVELELAGRALDRVRLARNVDVRLRHGANRRAPEEIPRRRADRCQSRHATAVTGVPYKVDTEWRRSGAERERRVLHLVDRGHQALPNLWRDVSPRP